jgi:hypothetical protein
MVTDGPFTETKEAVGGFDIIECGSPDEAVEIAARYIRSRRSGRSSGRSGAS